MIQEESAASLRGNNHTGRLYDFWEYRKKKQYFTQPLLIELGAPLYDTYQLVCNIVYQDKQIIGVKKESEPTVITLVEALIENGQFVQIKALPELLLTELVDIFSDELTKSLL